jgi:hypothetical protein
MDSGQKCATATVIDATTPPSAPPTATPTVTPSTGPAVKVTLAYTADMTQMVSNTRNQTASVLVSGTDNYCVSAVAVSGTGVNVTIPKVLEPCTMTVPAMQPAGTVTGPPARTTTKEDEEGY